MFNLTDLENLDIKQLDLTKLDLSKLDISKLDPRHVQWPEFPSVDLPELPVDRIADLARDAAYAGIGLAVAVVEQAEQRRKELTDDVTARVRKLVAAAG